MVQQTMATTLHNIVVKLVRMLSQKPFSFYQMPCKVICGYLFSTFMVSKRQDKAVCRLCCSTKVLPIKEPTCFHHNTFCNSLCFFFPLEPTLCFKLLLLIIHTKHGTLSSWDRLYCLVTPTCFMCTACLLNFCKTRNIITIRVIIWSKSLKKKNNGKGTACNIQTKQRNNILCGMQIKPILTLYVLLFWIACDKIFTIQKAIF